MDVEFAERKLAQRERACLQDSLEQARATLAAFERRREHRGAEMARRTIWRLEREVLNARLRAAGLPVPPAVDHPPRGTRERAACPFEH